MASEEILDLKIKLSTEEANSAPIKRLMRELERMKRQMQDLGKVKIGGTFIDDKLRRDLLSANKGVDTLSQTMLTKARADKTAGKMSQAVWSQMTQDIRDNVKALNGANRTQKKDLESKLRRQVKYADAYAVVWNSSAERREQIISSSNERIGRIEDAAEKRRMRLSDNNHNQWVRNRHAAYRSMERMYDRTVHAGRSAVMYGGAAAAGAGYAGGSAINSRMKAETAEINMQTFADMSKIQVQEMRKTWGDASAIKYGLSPDKMMEAFTEVIKTGIPKDKARAVSDAILQSTAGLDLDLKNTTKFAARSATLTGDMKDLDPDRIAKIMNGVAVAATSSGADANEIIAGNRRGAGVYSTSTMTPEQLSGFTAAGISADMQSGKVGTFMSFLTSELINGKFETGKRGADLSKASSLLGFGSKSNLSGKMATDTTATIETILERMGNMSGQKRAMVADLLGMREWRDEFGTFVQVRDDVFRIQKEIADPKNKNFNSNRALAVLQSLRGRWNSLKSAFGLLWEAIGSGFEDSFGQMSEFMTKWISQLDKGVIKKNFAAGMQGLVEGLGFNDWNGLMESVFGKAGAQGDHSESIKKFAKGFGEGIRYVVDAISSAFKAVASFMGVDAKDPQAMGKLTAQLIGMFAALTLLAPVIGILGTFATLIITIATALGAVPATAAAVVGGAVMDLGIPESSIRRKGEGYDEFRARRKAGRDKAYNKNVPTFPQAEDPMGSGGVAQKMSSIGEKFDKMGAKIERIAFQGNGITDFSSRNRTGGGIQNAMYGGGGGGGGGGGMGKLLSGIGTPSALMGSVPGAALPSFGAGRSGSILKNGGIPSDSALDAKDKAWFGRGSSGAGAVKPSNIPSFSGGGGSATDNVGAGLSGNAFLAARRAKFGEELKNDPNLRMHLAAMQRTEGASKGGTIESLMNRADMQGKSMRQMLGFGAEGQINPRSFYGPIRRGEMTPAIRALQNNPKEFAKYDSFTNRALGGGHVIGGHTDQGLPTDPNGSKRTGIPGLRLRNPNGSLDGNEFTDWVGPGSSYGKGRNGAINYRKFIESGIAGSGPVTSAVPSAAANIQNVPTPAAASSPMGGVRHGLGGASININGGSHDAESLATLVQRRVDDSMQWRTHDSESEYN